jgi:hypothetical protein
MIAVSKVIGCALGGKHGCPRPDLPSYPYSRLLVHMLMVVVGELQCHFMYVFGLSEHCNIH